MGALRVERRMAASPEVVYALVSDLPRMGEWSDENTGGRWIGGACGPALGARFKGTNRSARLRWSTVATVTAADPGRRFSFRVRSLGLKVADWSYEIEPDGDGCLVTESWVDLRDPLWRRITGAMTGVSDRRRFAEASMAATLEAIARAAAGS